jgi:NAD(P)-dependent dehydrogenase (short-subunit alcohol dehydrogenase family)
VSTPPGKVSAPPEEQVLITRANVGIGKEVARQLALRPEIARICLACRNHDLATQEKAELVAVTSRDIFDVILMDVTDLGSVRVGVAAINGSLDALVMIAGVIGNETDPRLQVACSTPARPASLTGPLVNQAEIFPDLIMPCDRQFRLRRSA